MDGVRAKRVTDLKRRCEELAFPAFAQNAREEWATRFAENRQAGSKARSDYVEKNIEAVQYLHLFGIH